MLEATFFPSWSYFFLAGGIVFFSQFLYATLGFGGGMFAISLLTLLLGQLELLVPFFLLVCLPTECCICFTERKHIHPLIFTRLLLLLFPAVLVGAFLLRKPDNALMNIMLGLVIMVLSVYYLFFEDKMSWSLHHPGWLYLFGSVAGFMGGLFGMAGAPLIFYFKTIGLNKRAFRVALISVFLVLALYKVAAYCVFSLFTPEVLTSALLILPFALAGMEIGSWLHHKLPEQKFKRITSAVLFACGLLIVIKQLG